MTYLLLLPCIFAVYLYAQTKDVSGSYFATIATLLTVVLSNSGLFSAGVDTMVAVCLTMCTLNLAQWHVEREFTKAIKAGLVEIPKAAPLSRFCTTQTHDFAVAPAEYGEVVELINNRRYQEVSAVIADLSAEQRQGMYANIDYSALSSEALSGYIASCSENIDARILFGHLKVCEAKAHGLVPGVIPGEEAAAALATAFRHFRIALRAAPKDAEALCGLIIAKGCIALNDDQIEASLVELLQADSRHLHGMVAAARFLITSTEQANRFVELVERGTDCKAMIAIARVIAHIECGGFSGKVADSSVIADLYRQLKCYLLEHNKFGSWQQAISNNIIAYAFQGVGDDAEANKLMLELEGGKSPYPWRRMREPSQANAVLAF